MSNNKLPQLVSLLFAARTPIHISHLQSKSYSEHVTLGGYYESVIDHADAIAENHQGRYGIIDSYPVVMIPAHSGVEIIKYVRSWVDSNRAECGEYYEIQNLIDELQNTNNSTIYKLENLK